LEHAKAMALIIEQFPARDDNFGVLIHDDAAGLTAAIDAPEEAPIVAKLKDKDWRLDYIFATHHHLDHVEANLALKAAYGCTISGPAAEAAKIPGIDVWLSERDRFLFGSHPVDVIETPGHTLGHITYHLPEAKVAFVGDTLFAVGCGRVIEGTMEMMWQSLEKLLTLPDDTAIYCGHEYTEANIRFALTIEPGNAALVRRAAEVTALRAAGKATLPTTLALEKATNPFLRVDEPAIRKLLGMAGAPQAAVFGEIRKRKDSFR
jgi:hydroxyacylglutathione hydrolase